MLYTEEKGIRSVLLELTTACNKQCAFCYHKAINRDVKYIPLDTIIQYLNSEEYKNISTVILSGGEPLLYYKITDLLHILEDNGKNILVFTNGLLFNQDFTHKIYDLKRTTFRISIEVKKITEIENILRFLISQKIKIKYSITIYDDTVKEVEECLNTLYNIIGINEVVEIVFPMFKGKAIYTEQNMTNLFEIITLLMEKYINGDYNIVSQYISVPFVRYLMKGRIKTKSCTLYRTIKIDVEGKVYACPFATEDRYIIGNMEREEYVINNQHRTIEIGNKECENCEYQRVCPGDCPISREIKNSKYSCELLKYSFQMIEKLLRQN